MEIAPPPGCAKGTEHIGEGEDNAIDATKIESRNHDIARSLLGKQGNHKLETQQLGGIVLSLQQNCHDSKICHHLEICNLEV